MCVACGPRRTGFHRRGAHHPCRVITCQVHRDHIPLGCLPHQFLLGGYAHAGPGGRVIEPQDDSFQHELQCYPRPFHSHRPEDADFLGPLHHAHAHGIYYGEENNHRHNQGDKGENGLEHAEGLGVEGLQFGQLPGFQVKPPVPDQLFQSRPSHRDDFGPMELQNDTDGLPFSPAVEKLLRQHEIHDDKSVIVLFHALFDGLVHIESDHVGRGILL